MMERYTRRGEWARSAGGQQKNSQTEDARDAANCGTRTAGHVCRDATAQWQAAGIVKHADCWGYTALQTLTL